MQAVDWERSGRRQAVTKASGKHTRGVGRQSGASFYLTMLFTAIAAIALVLPASVRATPVRATYGAEKIAVIRSLANSKHFGLLAITNQQARSCFNVRTYGRYAGIVPRGDYRGLCGQIDIATQRNGFQPWQPSNGISEYVHGRWRLLLEFDQAEPLQLERIGVPVSVYDTLFPGDPLGPQGDLTR